MGGAPLAHARRQTGETDSTHHTDTDISQTCSGFGQSEKSKLASSALVAPPQCEVARVHNGAREWYAYYY